MTFRSTVLSGDAQRRQYRKQFQEKRRAQRARQVAQEIHLMIGIIVLIIAILAGALVMNGFRSQAAADAPAHKYKYYQSVVLGSHDSLENYAVQYADPAYYKSTDEYIGEVMEINHLTAVDGVIQGCTPGSRLILPYYDENFIR